MQITFIVFMVFYDVSPADVSLICHSNKQITHVGYKV